jgi:hypothetical protein
MTAIHAISGYQLYHICGLQIFSPSLCFLLLSLIFPLLHRSFYIFVTFCGGVYVCRGGVHGSMCILCGSQRRSAGVLLSHPRPYSLQMRSTNKPEWPSRLLPTELGGGVLQDRCSHIQWVLGSKIQVFIHSSKYFYAAWSCLSSPTTLLLIFALVTYALDSTCKIT